MILNVGLVDKLMVIHSHCCGCSFVCLLVCFYLLFAVFFWICCFFLFLLLLFQRSFVKKTWTFHSLRQATPRRSGRWPPPRPLRPTRAPGGPDFFFGDQLAGQGGFFSVCFRSFLFFFDLMWYDVVGDMIYDVLPNHSGSLLSNTDFGTPCSCCTVSPLQQVLHSFERLFRLGSPDCGENTKC